MVFLLVDLVSIILNENNLFHIHPSMVVNTVRSTLKVKPVNSKFAHGHALRSSHINAKSKKKSVWSLKKHKFVLVVCAMKPMIFSNNLTVTYLNQYKGVNGICSGFKQFKVVWSLEESFGRLEGAVWQWVQITIMGLSPVLGYYEPKSIKRINKAGTTKLGC